MYPRPRQPWIVSWTPPVVAGPVSVWRFNPAVKAANITLSNADRTITSTSTSPGTSRSLASYASGKLYTEVSSADGVTFNAGHAIGLQNSLPLLTTWTGQVANSLGYRSDGVVNVAGAAQTASVAWTVTDTVMFAVDIDAKKFWVGVNGTWSGDPAAGTGGYAWVFAGPYFLAASIRQASGVAVTIPLNYAYPVPVGFTAA